MRLKQFFRVLNTPMASKRNRGLDPLKKDMPKVYEKAKREIPTDEIVEKKENTIDEESDRGGKIETKRRQRASKMGERSNKAKDFPHGVNKI